MFRRKQERKTSVLTRVKSRKKRFPVRNMFGIVLGHEPVKRVFTEYVIFQIREHSAPIYTNPPLAAIKNQ